MDEQSSGDELKTSESDHSPKKQNVSQDDQEKTQNDQTANQNVQGQPTRPPINYGYQSMYPCLQQPPYPQAPMSQRNYPPYPQQSPQYQYLQQPQQYLQQPQQYLQQPQQYLQRSPLYLQHPMHQPGLQRQRMQEPSIGGYTRGDSDEEEVSALLVEDLSKKITEKILKSYFGNQRKSGGGKVSVVIYDKNNNSAIIYFQQEGAVERIIHKAPHLIEEKQVKVSVYKPEKEEDETTDDSASVSEEEKAEEYKTIKIQAFNKQSTDEAFTLYFENPRKGGGDIEDFKRNNEAGIIYITFEKVETVDTIMQNCPHQIGKKKLEVSVYKPDKKIVKKRKDSSSDSEKEVEHKTIEVKGFQKKTSDDTIRFYFENPRKGGGDIEDFQRKDYPEVIYITFADVEAVDTIMQNCPHQIGKKKLEVSVYKPDKKIVKKRKDSSSDSEKEVEHKTIEVKGFQKKTSDDTIRFYFENPQKGGGDIEDFQRKDDPEVIYITFADVEVTKRVVEKTHKIDNCDLQVELYIPPPPRPSYTDRLLITGIKDTTTKDCLINFLEAKGSCNIEESNVVYGEEEGSALVHFTEMPDLDKLENVCAKKALEGLFLRVSKVPISNSIIVKGLKSTTSEDTVSYYFEGKRSGNVDNEDVEKVVMKSDDGYCLVYFKDHTVIEKILAMSKGHKLDGAPLTVSIYHECLGVEGGVCDPTWFKMPSPLEVKNLDVYKLNFIKESQTSMKALVKQLEISHAEIKWSGDSVVLTCTLTTSVKNAHLLSRSWTADAQKALSDYFGLLEVEKIKVLQDIWDDVEKQLYKKHTDGASMFVYRDLSSVIVVGYAKFCKVMAEKVKSLVKEVEEAYEKKKGEISETINKLKPIQFKLLLAGGFPKQMMSMYPGLNVNIISKKNEITFCGNLGDVQKAQVDMYESLQTTKQSKLTNVSEMQLQMLDRKIVREYIVKKLKMKSLVGVWEVTEQELTVLAFSDHDAVEVVHMLQNCVTENIQSLNPESVILLSSAQWFELTNKLLQTYPDVLKITPVSNNDSVVITATDDIMYCALEEVSNFFSENTIFSQTVKFSKATQRFLQNHNDKHISQIISDLKSQQVQILYGNNDKQFTIKATKIGMDSAMKRLQELAHRVQHKLYVHRRPGIQKLLESSKGIQFIHDLGRKERCVIERDFDGDDRMIVGSQHVMESTTTADKGVFSYGTKPDEVFQQPGSSSEIGLYYFCDQLKRIDACIQEIESYCGQEISEKEIKDEALKHLKQSEIKNLKDKYQVEVDYRKDLGCIVLKGMTQDVWNACEDVQKLLREIDHLTKRVVEKTHKIDNCDLQVELYIPPPPRPSYTDRLLITGIKDTTTKDCLINFLKAKGGCNIEESNVVYGEEEGSALVHFTEMPDLVKLEKVCAKKALEGLFLRVSKVPISNSIIVKGLKSTTSEDTVSYYFEGKRSGNVDNEDVEKVVMKSDDGYCLVYFKDHTVIEKILAMSKGHKLDGAPLTVSIYHECLGVEGGVCDPTWFKMPSPLEVKNLDVYKLNFIKESQTSMKALVKQLEISHAEIKWSGDSVVLTCTLTTSVKNARLLSRSWTADAQKALSDYFGLLEVEKIKVLQDIWDDVEKQLDKKHTDGASMFVYRDLSSVIVVGYAKFGKEMAEKVKSLVKEVEEAYEKKKREISETINKLKPIQLKLLLAGGFPKQMMSMYPGLNVNIISKKTEITFCGNLGDVQKAQLYMYELLQTTKQSKLTNVSEMQLQMLDRKNVREYIVKKLKMKSLVGVWEVTEQELTVLAFSDHDAVEVVHMLQNCVTENIQSLNPESVILLSSAQWFELTDKLLQTYPDVLKITPASNNDSVVITATDDIMYCALEEVSNFFSENTIFSQTVKFSKATQRFLQNHNDKNISQIISDLKSQQVQILYGNNDKEFTIKATKIGMDSAMKRLQELASRVQHKLYVHRRPGIRKLLESCKGIQFIHDLERKERCVIERDFDGDDRMIVGSQHVMESTTTADKGLKIVATCRMPNNRKLCFVEEDITKMKVDVIVNAANEKLDHIGGLARAIVQEGGDSIQKECTRYVSEHGRVSVGSIFESQPGKLPCKLIVHAVGPVWSGGHKYEEDLLKEAIFNSLETAEKNHCDSIAIPALSCGIYHYPVANATSAIVDAVKEHFEDVPNSSINAIYLADRSVNTVNFFVTAGKQAFGKRNVQIDESSMTSQVRSFETRSTLPTPTPRKREGDQIEGGFENVSLSDHSQGLKIGSITLCVKQGDLTRENVDCIVNSSNDRLDFGSGGVAQAIAKACGKSLMDECQKKLKKMKKKGIISTNAEGLKCKAILHVDTSHFNNWNKVISTCLSEAENTPGVTSIAFPALGTGIAKEKADEVAEAFVSAVHEFQKSGPVITDVRIIIFQADMLQSFINTIQKAAQKGGKSGLLATVFGAVAGVFSYGTKPDEVFQQPGSSSDIALYYFCDQLKRIDACIEEIESYCGQEISEKEIKDKALKHLKQSEIKNLKDKYQVEVDYRKDLGCIVLKGMTLNVWNACEDVQKLLREIDHRKQDREKAIILSKSVQWVFIELDTQGQEIRSEYDKDTNGIIEKAYCDKCPTVTLPSQDGTKYIINFNSMEEYPADSPTEVVKVIRKDLINASALSFEPPANWADMGADEEVKRVTLQTSSAEFQTVSQAFLSSVAVQTAKIIKIEQIQNKTLYQQYVAKKNQISKHCSQAERKLWHGTSDDAIVSLNTHGFNRSYCGKNATAFGDGVYFAVGAHYSAFNTYSRPNRQGYKHMYYVSVLTGDFVQGRRGMRVPPAKSYTSSLLYDSVVDNVNRPGMFIIFNDTQAYPDYLITFTV